MTAVAPAMLTAGCAALVVLLSQRPRLRLTGGEPAVRAAGTDRSPIVRLRPALGVLAAGGAWAVLGGVVGVAAGAVAAVTVWTVLGKVEEPSLVRRREQLAQELPLGIDLFGACLAAGAAPEKALLEAGRAVGGPVEEEFTAIHHRLELGVDAERVWAEISADPLLGPLGRGMARAYESGAPVEAAVRRLAVELRERAGADVEARARSIEVRAAAPLGLCLLPAFLLLGVVPMVAATFGSVLESVDLFQH